MSEQEGATKTPEVTQSPEDRCEVPGIPRSFPHYFHWLWEGGEFTSKVRCATCLQTRIRRHGEQDVVLPSTPAGV